VNREAYLEAATDRMRAWFEPTGSALPPVRVSVGWPARSATSASRRRIGECWSPDCAEDKTHHIFISPCLGTAEEALPVLVHELVHAAVGLACGHKGAFRKVATQLGLQGKMTSTTPGPELVARVNELILELGTYPHAKLDKTNRPKQSTRMLKLACPDCGYSVRTTAKWIEVGLPRCPCGTGMDVA
jgi:hypothetical protein